MGIFSQGFSDGMVASSLPVRGLGTLQYGIRAKIVAWAWMGHEDAMTELMLQHLGLSGPWEIVNRGRFPTAQKKPGKMGEDKKNSQNFLSARMSAHRKT